MPSAIRLIELLPEAPGGLVEVVGRQQDSASRQGVGVAEGEQGLDRGGQPRLHVRRSAAGEAFRRRSPAARTGGGPCRGGRRTGAPGRAGGLRAGPTTAGASGWPAAGRSTANPSSVNTAARACGRGPRTAGRARDGDQSLGDRDQTSAIDMPLQALGLAARDSGLLSGFGVAAHVGVAPLLARFGSGRAAWQGLVFRSSKSIKFLRDLRRSFTLVKSETRAVAGWVLTLARPNCLRNDSD